MKISCVWEHNGSDSILHASSYVGAYTRGETKDIALQKMAGEIVSYLIWKGEAVPDALEVMIVQEKASGLMISDADSDVLFEEERKTLSGVEYEELKALALKSAQDFLDLYEAISRLSEEIRLTVTLYYMEGYSIKEIAALMNTTESTIKNRLARARAKLKSELEWAE